MSAEEPFLRAIADDPGDELLRLVYADWLEEHGDPRSEFLRVEHALAKNSPVGDQLRELCARERELVSQVDAAWLQRVRRYTTPAPGSDDAKRIQPVAQFARHTTRLHPHRAVAPLPIWASKIGGRFLWPEAEPWPTCDACGRPMAPILQLRRRDVPDAPFPDGTDLAQLFWCPDEMRHDYRYLAKIWWRDARMIERTRDDAPDLTRRSGVEDWNWIVPHECAVYPEKTLEHSWHDDLYNLVGAELQGDIQRLMRSVERDLIGDLGGRLADEGIDTEGLTGSRSTSCRSTRLGGTRGYERDGRTFEHLATFATYETDPGSFRRWLSIEEQRSLAPPGEPLTEACFQDAIGGRNPRHITDVLGPRFGRSQNAYIYVARDREPWLAEVTVGD